jgi:hypothetical protein
VSESGQDGAGIGIQVNGRCFSFVLYNGSVSISISISVLVLVSFSVSVEGYSTSEAIGTGCVHIGTS